MNLLYQARRKKATVSSQRNGVAVIVMVLVLGGLAIALLTLAGQTCIQMKSIRNASLDNQQCSELIALGEQVLAASLLANAEFSSETIRLNLPQTSVLTNPSQPQIGIVELTKTASADSRNRWTIDASFGTSDGLLKRASKIVYLNNATK